MRGRLALVGVALGGALLPLSPSMVERVYSAGLYPMVQPWITGISNAVPVVCLDVLIVAVGAGWLALSVRDVVRRRSWPGALATMGARAIVWAAALYVGFLAAWGLNYRRVPLADKLQFDAALVSSDRARDLAIVAVGEVNALHGPAHAALRAAATGDDADMSLAPAFAQAQRDLGAVSFATPARPKSTIFDVYFQRAGVSGMTDPFFLETLVAGDLLPFERPFVIAHEWSHLAGITDEGEANFVGWLTCVRGTPSQRYSGWLFLFSELSRAVRESDRAALLAMLAPGPLEDLRAIARRIQQHVSPRVSAAGWRAYNQYLKANRVERGTDSYAEVVKLVLGVPFDAAWVPQRRATP
ncbi:MAG: DUF3810 family protein [Acidobacteria bacterium]|nr:DUF3810 family protein [Acidobacteriota bacterium]